MNVFPIHHSSAPSTPLLPLTPAVRSLDAPTLQHFVALLALQAERRVVTPTSLAAAARSTPESADAALETLLQRGFIQHSYLATLEPTWPESAPNPSHHPRSPVPTTPIRRRIRGLNLSLLARAQRLAAAVPVGITARLSVREVATIMGYASAGRVSPTLRQLTNLGIIARDSITHTITMLRDPAELALPGMLAHHDHGDHMIVSETGSCDHSVIADISETGRCDRPVIAAITHTGIPTSANGTGQTSDHRSPITDHRDRDDHGDRPHDHEVMHEQMHESPLPPLGDAARSDSQHAVFGQIDPAVQAVHRQANPRRTIPLGEWMRLAEIQQEIGVDALMIASASALRQDRPNGVHPNYYRATHQCMQRRAAREQSAPAPIPPPAAPAAPAPIPPPAVPPPDSARAGLLDEIARLAGEPIRSAQVRQHASVVQLTQLRDWLARLGGTRPWNVRPLAVGIAALRDGQPLPDPPGGAATDSDAWGGIADQLAAQGYAVQTDESPATDAPSRPWTVADVRAWLRAMTPIGDHARLRSLPITITANQVAITGTGTHHDWFRPLAARLQRVLADDGWTLVTEEGGGHG